MYLEKFELTHFRKFNETDNQIMFVKNSLMNNDKDEVDVGSDTTLIVGKNNVGKTTIVTALDKLINTGKFIVSDFNYRYLDKWLSEYNENNKIPAPYIEFKVTICLDDASQDLVTNLSSFLLVEDLDDKKIDIIIKYEITNEIEFKGIADETGFVRIACPKHGIHEMRVMPGQEFIIKCSWIQEY